MTSLQYFWIATVLFYPYCSFFKTFKTIADCKISMKEINMFIQQGCIQLNKSDSKDYLFSFQMMYKSQIFLKK